MDQTLYTFGEYRIDPLQRTLRRGDALVRLTGREFDTLWALALRAGTPVQKNALIREVWGDVTVTDDNLRQHVHALRQKLGRDCSGQEYIRNIPNRGYFLTASVRQNVERDPGESIPAEPAARQSQISDATFEEPPQPPEADSAAPIRERRRRVGPILAWMGGGTAVILAIIFMSGHIVGPPAVVPIPMGRLLTRLTSEGKSMPHVALSHQAEFLAISADGRQLFAASGHRHTLSVINTADLSVHEISLPRDAGPLAATRNGKLYIGSRVDGLMIFDIASGRLLQPMIPTGGPVFDMAATPDGAKLFLTLGTAGLKRLIVGKSDLMQISDRVSAQYLAIDPQGRLYVSYQNEGPAGQRGHDTVEIFDSDKEVRLGMVSGPPHGGWSSCRCPQRRPRAFGRPGCV